MASFERSYRFLAQVLKPQLQTRSGRYVPPAEYPEMGLIDVHMSWPSGTRREQIEHGVEYVIRDLRHQIQEQLQAEKRERE